MAKLNAEQQAQFKAAKAIAIHSEITILSYKFEGITIAGWFTSAQRNHCNVAITYCGHNDTFSRKIGVIEVMEKIHNERYITLPTYPGATMEDILVEFFAGAIAGTLNYTPSEYEFKRMI